MKWQLCNAACACDSILGSQAKQRKRWEDRSESDRSPAFNSPHGQAATALGTTADSTQGSIRTVLSSQVEIVGVCVCVHIYTGIKKHYIWGLERDDL